MTVENCNVLIIGSGPSGMVLACELLLQDIKNIIIVERLLEPQILHGKGLGIIPRALEILNRYDGVLDAIIPQGYSGVTKFEIADVGQYDYSANNGPWKDSKFDNMVFVDQYHTEAALRNYLERKGVRFDRGVEVTGIQDVDDFVAVECKVGEKQKWIRAKYVAGCDGAKSFVRKTLNIPYEGRTKRNSTVAFVGSCEPPLNDTTLEGKDLKIRLRYDKTAPYMILPHKMGFAFMTNLDTDQEKSWLSDERDSHGHRLTPKLSQSQLQQLFDARGLKHKITSVAWSTHFRINNRIAKSFCNGKNVFLIGDSAHSCDPFLGLGQNIAIQDAHNLGWKIGMVLKGLADPTILKTYTQERRADGMILMTQSRTNDALKYSPSFLRHMGIKLLFEVIPGFFDYAMKENARLNFQYASSLCSEVDTRSGTWSKMLSFPSTYSTRIGAGHRFPPKLLPEDAHKAEFTAVIFASKPNADVIKSQLLNVSNVVSACVFANSSVYKRTGVADQSCVMLIRPDHHVGLRYDFDYNCFEMAVVKQYLNKAGFV